MVKIFVKLLDEGTDVWKPVEAIAVREGVYQISKSNIVESDEVLEFKIGSLVKCEAKINNMGQSELYAVEALDD